MNVANYLKVINRLCKWRVALAGWQVGTRPKGDPECDAVSDHREVSLLMRAELNAITFFVLQKLGVSGDEFRAKCAEEAEHLMRSLEARFPGITSTDDGLIFDKRAIETMKNWRK